MKEAKDAIEQFEDSEEALRVEFTRDLQARNSVNGAPVYGRFTYRCAGCHEPLDWRKQKHIGMFAYHPACADRAKS